MDAADGINTAAACAKRMAAIRTPVHLVADLTELGDFHPSGQKSWREAFADANEKIASLHVATRSRMTRMAVRVWAMTIRKDVKCYDTWSDLVASMSRDGVQLAGIGV